MNDNKPEMNGIHSVEYEDGTVDSFFNWFMNKLSGKKKVKKQVRGKDLPPTKEGES